MSATRCAAHGVDAEAVAVMFPVAPAAAWLPSDAVARALLTGELPDVIVYSCATVCAASCVSVTAGPDWPWAA